jgi:hypothetical protein
MIEELLDPPAGLSLLISIEGVAATEVHFKFWRTWFEIMRPG